MPQQVIRTLVMRVAGMAESDLDQLIAPVYKKYENPVTTILAAAGDIQIHLRARCATEAEADGAAGGSRRADRAAAGRPHLFAQWRSARSGGRRTAAQAARARWRSRRAAPAGCWRSASRRSRAARIISWAASSPTRTRMKTELLGVPEETLAEHGAVSKETAEAMAKGRGGAPGRRTRFRSRAWRVRDGRRIGAGRDGLCRAGRRERHAR